MGIFQPSPQDVWHLPARCSLFNRIYPALVTRTGVPPLNDLIDGCAAKQKVKPVRANALKLELAGQFNFLARKR